MRRNQDGLLVRGEQWTNSKEAKVGVVTARKRWNWNCLKSTEPHATPTHHESSKSWVWFVEDNRKRTATYLPLGQMCFLRKGSFFVVHSFHFLFLCFLWVGLLFNLSRSAQDKKAVQIQRCHRTYQNHLSSLTVKARQKMLQNKISRLSGLRVWRSGHRDPWSLLIKRKWFFHAKPPNPSCRSEGTWLQIQGRFGVGFSFPYSRSSSWAWIFMFFFKAQQNPLSGNCILGAAVN